MTEVLAEFIPLIIAWLSPAPSTLLLCNTAFKIPAASWLDIFKAVHKKCGRLVAKWKFNLQFANSITMRGHIVKIIIKYLGHMEIPNLWLYCAQLRWYKQVNWNKVTDWLMVDEIRRCGRMGIRKKKWEKWKKNELRRKSASSEFRWGDGREGAEIGVACGEELWS